MCSSYNRLPYTLYMSDIRLLQMKFELKIIQVCFVVLLLHHVFGNSDTLEHFCGKYLSNFLANKCKLYNSPSNNLHKVRNRRGIVEECCRKPCSRRYLLCNYCAKSDEICGSNTDSRYY